MNELQKCRNCGVEIEAGAPFGHCPKCLLQLGMRPESSDPLLASGAQSSTAGQRGYDLLEQIGRGGMGVVYKARQTKLDRIVAVKMIRCVDLASPQTLVRFQLEARAAAKLDHPNIVPTYEVGDMDGQPFFSMKLVPGKNLAQRMPEYALALPGQRKSAKGKLSPRQPSARDAQTRIALLLAAVAHAVHYAHQHSIIHRDIKPSNILIDPKGQPHLTDFGVAKDLLQKDGPTRTEEVLGTPNYMAPEQATGGHVSGSADVYSLGAILYELLTGRPPFKADTAYETIRRLTQEEPVHPGTRNGLANNELATICLKCLEKDPLRRYSSALALAEDLERWLHHEPILARRASTTVRVIRWTRRNPLAATLILGFFLAWISTERN